MTTAPHRTDPSIALGAHPASRMAVRTALLGKRAPTAAGQLVVVGLGIQWAGQTTLAAKRAIEGADSVLFALADPWAARWVRSLHPRAESLAYPREGGTPRAAIYRNMVARILGELKDGKRVCAVFYGSATVLTDPAHEAVRQARNAGYAARMLPGVSSLECLFADLEIDPGVCGCSLYEAENFLVRARPVDTSAHLVLCQIALIGNRSAYDADDSTTIRRGLHVLGERLASLYPREHQAILYEAAAHPLGRARNEPVALGHLEDAKISAVSTLYVPPAPVETTKESE